MKRLTLLLALVVAFSLSALAQTDTQATTGQTDQTQTTTTKHKHSKKASTESSSTDTSMKGTAKESTLTGCLSGPNADNNYVLTNGRHRKGVEVTGSDELKNHVGHKVKLTGTWQKGAEASAGTEAGGGKASAKTMRTFNVTKIDHIADSCTAPAAGASSDTGTEGGKKKGKKGSSSGTSTTPPGL